MNNYLSSLVARTLNMTPPVRPRLRGLFEPASAVSAGSINGPQLDRSTRAPWRPESEIETATSQASRYDSSDRINQTFNPARAPEPAAPPPREVTQATLRPVESDLAAPQSLSPIRAPGEQGALAASEPAQPPARGEVPFIRRRLDTAEAIKERSPSVREAAKLVRAASRQDELAPRAAEPHHDATAPHKATPAIQTLTGKRAGETSLIQPPTAPAQTLGERELRTAVTRIERSLEDSSPLPNPGAKPPAVPDIAPRSTESQSRKSKAAPVAVHSLITPLAEFGPERLPLRQTRAQPAPTVRVTIGRIEVRAVQQSQAPAKPRASQPAMNLDDYLRRRSQGGSR